jgi:hypothetical protein
MFSYSTHVFDWGKILIIVWRILVKDNRLCGMHCSIFLGYQLYLIRPHLKFPGHTQCSHLPRFLMFFQLPRNVGSQVFCSNWIGSTDNLPNNQHLVWFFFQIVKHKLSLERNKQEMLMGLLPWMSQWERTGAWLVGMASHGGKRQRNFNSQCKSFCLLGCEKGEKKM